MNITKVDVRDPRKEGQYVDPILRLWVDEEVEETGDDIFNGDHSWLHKLTPCGPFVAVEVRQFKPLAGYTDWTDCTTRDDIGRLNVTGLYKEQLIDIEVHTPEEVLLDMAMPVARAKRLLRRHIGHYLLQVDEEAAMNGRLQWRGEQHTPFCFGGDRILDCPKETVDTVFYSGAHLNFCRSHLARHNSIVRGLRERSTTR